MFPQLLGLAILCGQPAADPTTFINRELAQRWQTEKITPAGKTSDLEFLRRASLDLLGRIPTLNEQESFMKDNEKERRRLLIDRLLAHEDYARHWADVWADWLLAGAGEPADRNAFRGFLAKHFARNGSHKELAEKILAATGTTADNPAGHFLSIQRGALQPKKDWDKLGQYDMVPATNQIFRILHAKRIQCVSCHDHPFDGDLRQENFHGMNIFLRQVRFTMKPLGRKTNTVEITDDPSLNKQGLLPFERRNSVKFFTDPRFYDSKPWKPDMKQTRREFFAEHFVKHPDFARGYVGFLWAHLFGRGLTETTEYDDMGEHNPVVHAKVMDRLAAEFVKSGHDPKAFLRWLCNTDVYALKSVANKTNAQADKGVFFGRMQARPLSRRQLAESLIVALTTDEYLKRRGALREELLRELTPFPPPAVQECEIAPIDHEGKLSIRQSLWLMNSDVIQRELVSPQGTVAKALKLHGATPKGLPGVVTDLFRITLCRPPTQAELQRLTDAKIYDFRLRNQTPQAAVTSYAQDLMWALLNSSEFGLNH